MFGGFGRCFEDDPFFRDPFAAHHEHMRQVLRSFSEPLGREPFLRLPQGREGAPRGAPGRAQQDPQLAPRGTRRVSSFSLMPFAGFGRGDGDFEDPFSAMDRIMSNMRNNMLEMHRKFDELSLQPEGHSFSSSSVLSYSKVGDEPAKVFQAASQTRTAPGGVKETRKALKDSESGLEKIAIGHHIQDRAHVIKKSRNARTGDEELNQEFINLDESEADTFDEEWQKEIRKFRPCPNRAALEAPRSRSAHYSPRPLGAPGSRMPRDSLETLSVKGTQVPLKSSRK